MQEEMIQLETDLSALGRATLFPATPNIATSVRRRLEAADRSARPEAVRPWQLAALSVAAAVILAAALVGNVAPAREAAANFFDRINIFETDESTEGLPRDIEGATTTLEQAEARVGFDVVLPQRDGLRIQQVLVQDFGETKVVVVLYVFTDHIGRFAFFESAGSGGKGLTQGLTSATNVPGLGDEAYWFEGERIVLYYDDQGQVIPESVRATDTNTLAWSANGRFYRIEGDLTQEEALEVAQTVR